MRRNALLELNPTHFDKSSLLLLTLQILQRPSITTQDLLAGNISILKELNEKIVEHISHQMFQENDIIFNRGDNGTRFYIILAGSVSVRISPSVSKILHEGDTFGELALLDDSPRTATCIAISEVHVAFVEKKDFQALVDQDAHQKKRDSKLHFLSSYQFLQGWSMRELKTLSYCFEEKDYKYGDTVFSYKDVADSLYFIRSGLIELSHVEITLHSDHPCKQMKASKRVVPICLANQYELIGEDCFVNEGQITFQVRRTATHYPDENRFYTSIVKSPAAKLYKILKKDVEYRFQDTITRVQLLNYITDLWTQRSDLAQEFVPAETIHSELSEVDTSEKAMGQAISSGAKKRHTDAPFMKTISTGPLLQRRKINASEKDSRAAIRSRLESSVIEKEEINALDKFKDHFLKMNKSYHRTKNYFDKKYDLNDKFFYYAFIRNTKRSSQTPKRRMTMIPPTTTSTKPSDTRVSQIYSTTDQDETLTAEEMAFSKRLGTRACSVIRSSTQNKYVKTSHQRPQTGYQRSPYDSATSNDSRRQLK